MTGLSADTHLQKLVEKVMAASAGEELLGLLQLPQLHSHQAQTGIRLCHSVKLPALTHVEHFTDCAFKPRCPVSHNWLHTPDCKVLNGSEWVKTAYWD